MLGTMEYYDKAAAEWAERGYESKRIADLGYEAVGIDFSEESLKIARQKNPTIAFYQEDMLYDYSYIGTVDGIIVIAGLVHIENENLPLTFVQMSKVLKKDGKLLVSIREGVGKMEDRSLCEIEGEQYDRNFIAHTLEELIKATEGLFSYQCEMKSDMLIWKYYVFSRI